jgi:hypothetical protein
MAILFFSCGLAAAVASGKPISPVPKAPKAVRLEIMRSPFSESLQVITTWA